MSEDEFEDDPRLATALAELAAATTAPIPQQQQTWLSVKEIAARWRISKMTVYRMIDDGELTAHVFGRGRLFRISLADVEKYEQNNVLGPEEATG